MKRTIRELIAELRAEAAKAAFATLLVYFQNEKERRLINSSQPDAEQALKAMLLEGGVPIGFIRAVNQNKDWAFSTRVLPEFEENEEARKVLSEVAKLTCFNLERQRPHPEN